MGEDCERSIRDAGSSAGFPNDTNRSRGTSKRSRTGGGEKRTCARTSCGTARGPKSYADAGSNRACIPRTDPCICARSSACVLLHIRCVQYIGAFGSRRSNSISGVQGVVHRVATLAGYSVGATSVKTGGFGAAGRAAASFSKRGSCGRGAISERAGVYGTIQASETLGIPVRVPIRGYVSLHAFSVLPSACRVSHVSN